MLAAGLVLVLGVLAAGPPSAEGTASALASSSRPPPAPGPAPLMQRGDGHVTLEGSDTVVRLAEGRLELHRGDDGRLRYASGAEAVILGWAPLEVRGRSRVLVWLLRRDENQRGVVPHESGWMSYGHQPWIHHHLALLAPRGDRVAVEWMSSGLLGADAVWVAPPSTVLVRREGRVERFAFSPSGWQLEQVPGGAPELEGVEVATGLLDVASVGDVMLGRGTALALDHLGYPRAFGDIRPLLATAQLRVGNLEACFTEDEARPVGRHDFFAPRRHLGALAFLGLEVMSLANNHCAGADVGYSTGLLAARGLAAVPHGGTVRVTRSGVQVVVTALSALPGAADGLMTEERGRALEALGRRGELVLALVHWGVELAPEPTEEQRRLGAWLLGHGVSAVLGSHPHVVQPLEVTPAGVIAFSQGNFVFDQEGYTATSATQRGEVVELRYHPKLGLVARAREIDIVSRAIVRPAQAVSERSDGGG